MPQPREGGPWPSMGYAHVSESRWTFRSGLERRVGMGVATAAMALLLSVSSALAVGDFSHSTFYLTGITPYRLAVADVDKDGHPDIVVANFGTTFASVLWNKGNGTFAAPQKLNLGAFSAPDGVAFGDFNKDGKLDIAVSNVNGGDVVVFTNKGLRKFKAGAAYTMGGSPIALAVGDFNKDGKLDIAVGDYFNDQVVLLKGNGHGAFGMPSGARSVGHRPEYLIAHDFNGDHKLDLVTANYGGSTLSLVIGKGNGKFAAAQTLNVGATPSGLAMGDFNGDGIADLAAANNADNNVSVLLGEPQGQFHVQRKFDLGGSVSPNGLAAGDFDGDHKLDLAVGEQFGGGVAILKGDGHGAFDVPGTTFAAGFLVSDVQTAKLDAGSSLDLAVADLGVIGAGSGGATVLLNH